jgi:hypothetical protein
VKTFIQTQDIESDLGDTQDSVVPSPKSANHQASLGKGPIGLGANVPIIAEGVPWYTKELEHNLQTLSKMGLRKAYRREATCHEGMLKRTRAAGRAIPLRIHAFRDFLALVGPAPALGASIDRRFNDWRDYEPENIRWADKPTQTNNRSCTILIQPPRGGQPLTTRQLAGRLGITGDAVRKRRRRGWTDADIVSGKRAPTLTVLATPKFIVESAPLGHVWMRCMALSYPGESFALTPAEKGMLRSFAETCGPVPAEDVLDHVIQLWDYFPETVVRDHGIYLPNVPERPTMPFILKYATCAVNSWLETNRLFIGDDLLVHHKPEFTREQIGFWNGYSPLTPRQEWLKVEAATDLSTANKLYEPGYTCLYLADLSPDDDEDCPVIPDHERDNL